MSVLGTYVVLDADGSAITDPVARATAGNADETDAAAALTAAREVMARAVDARVVLSGALNSFQGRMPGVLEEAILAIRGNTPLFIAGGFGGAAGNLAVALGIDADNWLARDVRESAYLDELRAAIADAGWTVDSNGLTIDENRRLAVTYRASEVASLVVRGLSRGTTGS
jgi:hypothetical protein